MQPFKFYDIIKTTYRKRGLPHAFSPPLRPAPGQTGLRVLHAGRPALYFRADLIPARFPPRGCRAAGRRPVRQTRAAAEAVRLLDWFLTELSRRELPVFAISGNHDSADRVAFGSALLAESRVYVSPVFSGPPEPITLTDAHGPVDLYLLPFLKPAMVRHVWPDTPLRATTMPLPACWITVRLTRPAAVCWWHISSWQELPPARARSPAWAA